MATHIATTFFKDYDCDALITDQSFGLRDFFSNLSVSKKVPFKKLYFFETKEMCSPKTKRLFLKSVWLCLFGDSRFNSIDGVYNEILYYNLDYALFCIFDCLKKRNRRIVVSKYEESVLGYNHVFNYSKLKLISFLRSFLFKRITKIDKQLFYCSFPELYEGKMKTVKLSNPSNSKAEIENLFLQGFGDSIRLSFSNYPRYIFFTSVYDFEGGEPIGEFEAVQRIASIVGKENLIIKQHPRDGRNIYTENGFNVENKSFVPWEAIQYYIHLENKVLLSVNSSALLSSAILLGKDIKGFYTFKLCNIKNNDLATESIRTINSLLSTDLFTLSYQNIHILNTERDLLENE